MEFNIWYSFLIVIFSLNIFVSIFLAKRDDLERFQKIAQIILVWLIPIVGAICLWLFNKSNDDNNNTPEGRKFGGGSGSGVVGD
ncbi:MULTISPECIES: hypothetical protein [unclassified Colwellia]|uniref:hypothetical protein n=1 Tax=unclassified Colwellia TaxID=196834 RepID=UPI0015F5B929|nr:MULTISPECIES: hypothetical protein [unclassified Colwellia]MBA6358145.1 hypothetical protein [Colwellia sp. BRX8-3]MBA6362064.1 hypothetical protein [Colwellia sp. BRX8-6]MBA6369762.1 hypothetical protein [Colwellia sp. BRX8-5]